MRSTKLPSWIERLAGLDPVPAPPHVFALTTGELRYGAFFRGPQGFAFDAERSVQLPDEMFVEGPLGGPAREPHLLRDKLDEILAQVSEPIEEASLVLPDTWLRLVFTELSELPKKLEQREQILRWKLKQLVPFRVEDLRVSEQEVTPFPEQQEPLRLLLGFGVEKLIGQIESVFAAAGIQLGLITNTTLALMASLQHTVANDELSTLICVHDDAYTMSFFRQRQPIIYRYKAFNDGGVYADSVLRDLRLTNSFVRQHFPDTPLRRSFLAAPAEAEEQWLRWISDELDAAPEPLTFEHFELTRSRAGASWLRTAPMLGAACLEVS